uniref:Uncharacterized protein n=1 Tax=Siphoviridae sp. ctuvC1 TaxID=2826507 RepID=A0A8S5LZJ7_9CAUD|nr:MAG TPA: hypothetical protein [Siphoviridae sp. ctuvC1]
MCYTFTVPSVSISILGFYSLYCHEHITQDLYRLYKRNIKKI